MIKKFKSHFLIVLGFLLSPLSWWNDLFVNIPLAYLFSIPFSFLGHAWFVGSFIAGYWFTNFLGFFLLHKGIRKLMKKEATPSGLIRNFLITLLYTLLVAICVFMGWIKPVTHYFSAS